jgi:Flp pilus assembly protein TadD
MQTKEAAMICNAKAIEKKQRKLTSPNFILKTVLVAGLAILSFIQPHARAGEQLPMAVIKRAGQLKARALSETGRHKDALEVLLKLNTAFSDDRYILADTARAYRNLGDNENALQIYSRLLKKYPADKDYILESAYILSDLKKFEQARELIENNLAQSSDPAVLMLLASIASQKGDYSAALEYLETIVQKDPSNIRALLDLGSLYVQQGKTQKGIGLYQKAEALAPDEPDILKSLAYAWSGIDPYKQRKYLFRLIKLNPGDYEVLYMLAENHYSLYPAKAREYYKKTAEIVSAMDSAAPNVLKIKAKCLVRTGRAEKGLLIYRELIEKLPKDYDLINDYAETLIELKQYEKALEVLKPLESRI